MNLLRRFASGMRAADQSLATGLLIGLIVWTLTHLVDGVASSGTVEYAVKYFNDVLSTPQHTHVYRIDVQVTNLSRDAPVPDLEVSIQNPRPENQAVFYPTETVCTFGAPSWAGSALCDSHEDGGTLQIPLLVPGTSVSFSMKYTGSIARNARPIVRIRPGTVNSFRLIEPGLETFLTRHETGLLLAVLGLAASLFFINVSTVRPAGSSDQSGSNSA